MLQPPCSHYAPATPPAGLRGSTGCVAVEPSSFEAPGFSWSSSTSVGCVTAGLLASAVSLGKRQQSASRSRRQPQRVSLCPRQAEDDDAPTQAFLDAFPFSAVVGQEDMKLALLVNLVDPSIGGVMISGDRGTGKSCAVRALTGLLPDIACVAGDKYNSNPEDKATMSDEARAKLASGEELKVVTRPTPFVELPLGATEDRVTGTIDIEKALLEGGKAFEPGILARVNRGILYIDEVNLLDDQLVDVLLDSAAGGWNTVEREGISVRHPARFVLIGTSHPDEGDIRPQLLDRFGLTVAVRTLNSADDRVEVLRRRTEWESSAASLKERYGPEDEKIKQNVIEARKRLPNVKMDRKLKVKISKLCSALNVDGLRGDIVVNRAALALAALEDRPEATEEDVRRMAVMCLQHRLRKDVLDALENDMLVVEALVKEFGAGPPQMEAKMAVEA
mmetsp:Transcript_12405/g.29196  ORF Transcript_12405/g.29196 Transcript_12405/m.29196 type:complete len:448 (+) Transcript_12405:64-1407(+)